MGSGHSHGTATGQHRNRLIAVLAITLTIFVVEVVGGLVSGSLALLADAGHMLTDAAGVGLALLAVTFAAKPATPERTFGYQRSEILAAVVNALLLFGVAAYVLVEAARRLTDPPVLGSAAVILSGVVILATGFTEADAIASAVIGLMILPRTWGLLREAVDVLLESMPKNVDLAEVRDHILGIP